MSVAIPPPSLSGTRTVFFSYVSMVTSYDLVADLCLIKSNV